MQIQRAIEKLGYSAKEARVYLAALSLGECHVSDIALKTKLPRTTVQVVIEKLHKDGLMNFYVRRRYKHWVAENPVVLLERLEEKQNDIKTILPELKHLREKGRMVTEHTKIKIFTGTDEIHLVLDDIIAGQHNIFSIIPQDAFLELFKEKSLWKNFRTTCTNHFLRMRILAPNSRAGKNFMLQEGSDLHTLHILPGYIDIQTAVFIYGKKVAIIMLNHTSPTAIVIEDSGIRDTQMALFEELWGQSGESSLLQKDTFFRSLVDILPQPLLIANEKAEIQYVNLSWEKHFGYSLSEVEGKNPRLLQSGDTPNAVFSDMWTALNSEQEFKTDLLCDKKKDGTCIDLCTVIFPLRLGGQLYYIQIVDNITEHKRVALLQRKFIETVANEMRPSLDTFQLLGSLLAKQGDDKVSKAITDELVKLDSLLKKMLVQ